MRRTRLLVAAALASGLVGCNSESSGPSNEDAAKLIQMAVESHQVCPYGQCSPCSDWLTINSVKITDKTVSGKTAIVEAEIEATAVNSNPNIRDIATVCTGQPLSVGQKGQWQARYNFELWDSGWRLSGS